MNCPEVGSGMIRRIYDWTIAMAEHRHALSVLALVAFVESVIFPIPPDLLLIPMILAAPSRAWIIASVALLASVLGGLLGYLIGSIAFEELGRPILEVAGKTESMMAFNERFNEMGFWVVLTAGLTPFPYKVITIMSGWTQMPLVTFVMTSVLARGLRFFCIAFLLWKFGQPIREFIERRLGLVFVLLILILIFGFWVVRFL